MDILTKTNIDMIIEIALEMRSQRGERAAVRFMQEHDVPVHVQLRALSTAVGRATPGAEPVSE